jgi:hypothetical protein
MIRRTLIKMVRFTQWFNFWVYDHFTISGYIRCDIPIAWLSIVLPTTSHVHKVELALWTPSFLDIKGEPYLKIWRLRYLHKEKSI